MRRFQSASRFGPPASLWELVMASCGAAKTRDFLLTVALLAWQSAVSPSERCESTLARCLEGRTQRHR